MKTLKQLVPTALLALKRVRDFRADHLHNYPLSTLIEYELICLGDRHYTTGDFDTLTAYIGMQLRLARTGLDKIPPTRKQDVAFKRAYKWFLLNQVINSVELNHWEDIL